MVFRAKYRLRFESLNLKSSAGYLCLGLLASGLRCVLGLLACSIQVYILSQLHPAKILKLPHQQADVRRAWSTKSGFLHRLSLMNTERKCTYAYCYATDSCVYNRWYESLFIPKTSEAHAYAVTLNH